VECNLQIDKKNSMDISSQIFSLIMLSLPVACIAWTITHEEIFREPREYCLQRAENGSTILERKFFYMFTCEYCLSHYITILILFITGFKLLYDDWRGYLISGFSIVWIANIYMSLYAFIRIDLKKVRAEAETEEKKAGK